MKCKNLIHAGVMSALLTASASVAFASVQYLVTDLGTLSGPISSAVSIDSIGRVAGISMLANSHMHAVLWNGAPIDLGTIGTDGQSTAYAVNDVGQVVGISYNYGDIQSHAFQWQAGVLTSLGDFSPRDVNVSGVVVGHRTFYNPANLWVDQACRWTNGVLVDLGTLGGNTSDAFAINGSGWIVGQSFLSDNLTVRACLWTTGGISDLGTIAGTAAARSAAADINDNGQVVGWSEVTGGQPHACLFQLNASGQVLQRFDLGVLGGGYSYAYGINNNGVVVGSSNSCGIVWRNGSLTDLNAVIPQGDGWLISRGAAVNDDGVIVGEGVRLGFGHAVKLTPVACLKGDMNDDGFVDGRDVQSFLGVVFNGGTQRQICAGDVESVPDGAVTQSDVANFVQCLLAGGCN